MKYVHTKKKKHLHTMLRTGTHMTLEGGEVDVGDKKDRLRLVFCHCLEDSDVAALVQEGYLDIWPN